MPRGPRPRNVIEKVKKIYDGGAESALWQLLLGRMIHAGGYESSHYLATQSGITPGMNGVDLCCNQGESMRFLIRNFNVSSMTGVELTKYAIKQGKQQCFEEKMDPNRIKFICADVTEGLPMLDSNKYDFVWGEDAFCYLPNKTSVIISAARILKSEGILVFSDLVRGMNKMTKEEYQRFLDIFSFPFVHSMDGYNVLMEQNGFEVFMNKDSQRLSECFQLCVDLLQKQLKNDALRILGYNKEAFERVIKDFNFLLKLAREGKVCQGLFIARKMREIKRSKL